MQDIMHKRRDFFCIFFGVADSSPYGNIYPEASDNTSSQITAMSSVMAHI